jgi:hypothetical protein
VGGSLPGDALLKQAGETAEQIATHPHPFYTPIATFGSVYEMEPVAYGLKFAGLLSGGTFLPASLTASIQAAGVDGSAYAVKLASGEISVIVLNKDAEKDLDLVLDFGSGNAGAVKIDTLHAPSLDSRSAQITHSAHSGHLKGGQYAVTVPHSTGLRVTLTHAG